MAVQNALVEYTPLMIIQDINGKNGLSLSADDVVLSVEGTPDGTWLEENGQGNTLLRIKSREESNYTGEVVCSYNRANINTIAAMLGNHLGLPKHVDTVHKALPYFLLRHGVVFTLDDFEDGAVTWGEEGATFTMTAKTESLTWMGTADFRSVNIAEELQDILPTQELPKYPIFRDITDKKFAETLVYSIDFTSKFDEIVDIDEYSYDPTAMTTLLTEMSPKTWTMSEDPQELFSLYQSRVTYNGLNTNLGIVNKNYKYVMFIEIWKENQSCEGSLILHYNDPIVEEVVEAPAEEPQA